jgi:hypothetical protein
MQPYARGLRKRLDNWVGIRPKNSIQSTEGEAESDVNVHRNLKMPFHHRLILQGVGVPNLCNFDHYFTGLSTPECQTLAAPTNSNSENPKCFCGRPKGRMAVAVRL